MSPGKRDAAFLLFLVGFGVQGGIVPLHIWLRGASGGASTSRADVRRDDQNRIYGLNARAV